MIEETQHFLKNHAYLYENLQSDDRSKAFRSIFMMTLLAEAYVPSVKGFLDIPSLNTLAIHESGISGILGLCGAAVSLLYSPLQRRLIDKSNRSNGVSSCSVAVSVRSRSTKGEDRSQASGDSQQNIWES